MANLKDLIVNGVSRIIGNLFVSGKIYTNGKEVATKEDFQAGVDGIYNAIVAQGTTPSSKSQSDVVTGIGTMATNKYNSGKTDYNPTSATLSNAGALTVKNSAGTSRYTTTFTNNYDAGNTAGQATGKTNYEPTSATLSNAGALSVKNAAGTERYSTTFTNNYNKGVSDTKVGTASAADVRSGKTFTNSSSVGATGTMADATTSKTNGTASATASAGTASVKTNPSASASLTRTGNIGTTTAPTSGTAGTDYWEFKSSASSNSGVVTATGGSASASVTASSVSVSAGYNASAVTASTTASSTGTKTGNTVTTTAATASDSSSVYLTKSSVPNPTITIDSAGKITASSTHTAGYNPGGTASNTKQMTTQAAKTVTPSTSAQTAVSSGTYCTGDITVGAINTETTTLTPGTKDQDSLPSTGKYFYKVTVKGVSVPAAGNILSGSSVSSNGTTLVSGSMTNQGAKTSSLNCGGSYTIPAGYHNGSGKITANSLDSQTGVDSGKTAITASSVASGYQGWVNGSKISGTASLLDETTQAGINTINSIVNSEYGMYTANFSDNADLIKDITDDYDNTDRYLKTLGYKPNMINYGVQNLSDYIPKIVSGTKSLSTSSTTTVTLGFKPKILVVEVINTSGVCTMSNVYNSNWSAKYYMGYASTASSEQSLPNTNVVRIQSISDTGFVFGKTNSASSYNSIRYFAIA